jgi:hypothetical protein
MNLYYEYAKKNNVVCNVSNLMGECNKHFIIKAIHEEIPTGKCATFEEDYDLKIVSIIVVNRISLISEAFVIVDLKYMYDPKLIESERNTFAYLVFRN